MCFETVFRPTATAVLALVLLTGCVKDTDEALDGPPPGETAAADTAMTEMRTDTADGNTLWAAMQQNERLTTMTNLLDRVGLDIVLRDSDASYTVFAPTDEAFERLDQTTLSSLRDADNAQQLREILTAHLVEEDIPPQQLRERQGILSTGATNINVEVANDSFNVDNAAIVNTDTTPDNGVIYVIDSVILPLERSLREGEGA